MFSTLSAQSLGFSVNNPESWAILSNAKTLEEVRCPPMRKPSGKYNVHNKITLSEGTSH